MSVYLRGKTWRYDFMIKGKRHTGEGYRTKSMSPKAEANHREEVGSRKYLREQTDMGFLDMINLRLDYLKDFSSRSTTMRARTGQAAGSRNGTTRHAVRSRQK